ncbi:glycosyltransferase family 4 protein [Corynebacterium macginleyi]|uniref:glycosyltransferase family 4 protein n=1 Tax=Corynebacterium macginleyi TaxID=38290 RepID=UPI0019097F52|nr:glycosyltransferase family 4 protein [Corynebacterium macginleyi]MBK4178836.1 glycosyltransferase [Corynebacterium macginleyi]
MARILLVTNDFPPKVGGIQSYLRDYLEELNSDSVVVFASTQEPPEDYDASVAYKVIRWPHRVMLPTPATKRRMQEIIRQEAIDVVWFGAAAPLALMGKAARRAGARRIVATTHGHEVGWSMVPGARQCLRRIGDSADAITYISDYTLRRLRGPFGPHPAWVHLPSGVSLDSLSPATHAQRAAAKAEFGVSGPTVVCISRLVPRKGQDQLLRAMPEVREEFPDAQLMLIGRGRYHGALQELAELYCPDAVIQPASSIETALHAADIFAMPARTRGGGLDVEGLGIVYLEAQACGVPVVAGDSGGAPETITEETGIVVKGDSVDELVCALKKLLRSPEMRTRMGQAGRRHVEKQWSWQTMGQRLRQLMA